MILQEANVTTNLPNEDIDHLADVSAEKIMQDETSTDLHKTTGCEPSDKIKKSCFELTQPAHFQLNSCIDNGFGNFKQSIKNDASIIGSVVWAKVKDLPWWPSIILQDSSSILKSPSHASEHFLKPNFCQISTLGLNPVIHSLHKENIQWYNSVVDYALLSQKTKNTRNCQQKVPKDLRQPWKRAILDANELKSVSDYSARIELFTEKFPNRKYALPEELVKQLHFEPKPVCSVNLGPKTGSLQLAIQNSRKRKLAASLRTASADDCQSLGNSENDSMSDTSSVEGRKAKQKLKTFSAELAPLKVQSTLEALSRNPKLGSVVERTAKGRPKNQQSDLETALVQWSAIISNPQFYKNSVCVVCEHPGELLLCRNCVLFYHRHCYQDLYNDFESSDSSQFICKECRNNEIFCFACMEEIEEPKNSENILLCSVKFCRKFYHKKCAEKYKLRFNETEHEELGLTDAMTCYGNDGHKNGHNKFVCPQHICATCYVADPHDSNHSRGKFIKCHRCPLAYHTINDDSCIPAGSNIISSSYLVCPLHFKYPNKHVNVNWCFFCAKGGDLICCEFCPAAFHRACLPNDEFISDEKHWLCENCRCGSFPKYGDVVWAKLASYRWWPAQIVHPWLIPEQVMRSHSSIGEYVVYFLGTYNYSWLPGHRVFLYEENDDKTKSNNSSGGSGLNQQYVRGVKEAVIAFQQFCARNEQKIIDAQRKIDDSDKPPPYKYMPHNRPVYPVKVKTCAVSENSVCSCKSTDPDPCGPDSNCMNRITQYECHPATCPAGADKCQNQRFAMFQYSPTDIFKSENKGWGLRASDDISCGVFVGEYCGELIDENECKARVRNQNLTQNYNFYFCVLDRDRVIDASKKGNHLRFINHSCEPNCQTQVWTVNGDQRVGVFALRDIEKNEELTFNYNLETLGETKIRCFCSAPSCSGYIGVKSKLAEETSTKRPSKGRTKSDRNSQQSNNENSHDETCFQCKKGGELVFKCDRVACTRAYHEICLSAKDKQSKLKEKWICPCHFCNVCNARAKYSCVNCSSSTCVQHSNGIIFVTDFKSGEMKCADCLASKTDPDVKDEIVSDATNDGLFNLSNVDIEELTRKCISNVSQNIADLIVAHAKHAGERVAKGRRFELDSDSETEADSSTSGPSRITSKVEVKLEPPAEIKMEQASAEASGNNADETDEIRENFKIKMEKLSPEKRERPSNWEILSPKMEDSLETPNDVMI